MNTAALRRKLLAAIRAAEDAMAKAERDKKPMTRDTMHGRILMAKEIVAMLDESEGTE